MRNSFHVYIHSPGTKARSPHASHNTYELARDHAKELYSHALVDTMLEITSGGLTVWGPFVVGGKAYRP